MDSGLSASDVALMDRGGFGDGGAFMWIFALLILAGGFNGGGLFGGNGYHPQYATQDFVQNGFNFNDLQDQNRDIMNAITSGTAQSVAATNQTYHDTLNALSDKYSELARDIANVNMSLQQSIANENQCCCNTLRAIDGVNYNAAINTAAINANTTAQTQKILDAISGNRIADMQNQINALQLANAMNGVVRYPTNTAYAVPSPCFGGCGCNGSNF